MKTKNKSKLMKKFAGWACLIGLGLISFVSHAARPAVEGKSLAQEGVRLIKKMEPMVLGSGGLKSASTSMYFQVFENPLQDHLKKWPTDVDPEIKSWGDYFYCRDAVMSLVLIGMAQKQGNLGQQSDRKIADYQRTRNKCYEAASKSPDQVR